MSTAPATSGTIPSAGGWVGTRGWMTTGQAARRLGYSRQTLLRWCEAGEIPGARKRPGKGRKSGDWRIPIEWVREQISPVVRRKPG